MTVEEEIAEALAARQAAAQRTAQAAVPGGRSEGLATAIPEAIGSAVAQAPPAFFGGLGAAVEEYGDPTRGTYRPGPVLGAAMGVTGAPTMLPGGAVSGAIGMGAVRDPNLWHGISKVKLPKPLSEMTAELSPVAVPRERLISPGDLQGSNLLPLLGDRASTGYNLTGFNGFRFDPVPMQGGHGFMAAQAPKNVAWSAAPAISSRIENEAARLVQSGRNVHGVYTAMGERAPDFSHHISLPLARAVQETDVTRAATKAFDQAMKDPIGLRKGKPVGEVPDWPGLNSPKLESFLMQEGGGDVRNKFAKIMDTKKFQDMGFPSVAEARFAITDERLLHAPTGASGLSVAKLDPGGTMLGPSGHITYSGDTPGKYVGGFGRSIPKEVMYPDLISAYKKAGYSPLEYDYLMQRGLTGAPKTQLANQRWVDRVSKWMEMNPKETMKYAIPGSVIGGLAAQDNYRREP